MDTTIWIVLGVLVLVLIVLGVVLARRRGSDGPRTEPAADRRTDHDAAGRRPEDTADRAALDAPERGAADQGRTATVPPDEAPTEAIPTLSPDADHEYFGADDDVRAPDERAHQPGDIRADEPAPAPEHAPAAEPDEVDDSEAPTEAIQVSRSEDVSEAPTTAIPLGTDQGDPVEGRSEPPTEAAPAVDPTPEAAPAPAPAADEPTSEPGQAIGSTEGTAAAGPGQRLHDIRHRVQDQAKERWNRPGQDGQTPGDKFAQLRDRVEGEVRSRMQNRSGDGGAEGGPGLRRRVEDGRHRVEDGIRRFRNRGGDGSSGQ